MEVYNRLKDEKRKSPPSFSADWRSVLDDWVRTEVDLSRYQNRMRRDRDELAQRLLAVAKREGADEGQAQELAQQMAAELAGYGPIQPLLDDPSITEIMVNGPDQVWVERRGLIRKADVVFRDLGHLKKMVERIVAPTGRRVDEASPYVDLRLPDGSRVNIIISPVSLLGPVITIRRFPEKVFTVDDLIAGGALTEKMASFLQACVAGKMSTIVSGGTGSGKTTTLNVIYGFIPAGERIITVEDAAELRLPHEHVVPLEARPPNMEGRGEVTIRSLVRNALRMRPDRIIVGEVRGAEALDMLQAMNTGHDGSLGTIHANSETDAVSRLETAVILGSAELPLPVIRAQIGSAVRLIIQQARLRDGSRKIVGISEVFPKEGGVGLCKLCQFVPRGLDGDGRILGDFAWTGEKPSFLDRLADLGMELGGDFFEGAGGRSDPQ